MPQQQNISEQQEIQEIIGAMPQKVWSRGVFFVLLVACSIVLIAYFVPYPDVVEVPVVITTQQPLVEMKTFFGGEISALLVENKAGVKSGQLLVVFKNSADYSQVNHLKNELDKLNLIQHSSQLSSFQLSNIKGLGSLTEGFGVLEMQFKKFKFQQTNQHVVQQVSALHSELLVMKNLDNSLQKQIEKLSQKVGIAEENFNDFKRLEQDGAASKLELDAAQSNWLRQQTELESKNTQAIQNQLNTKRIESQILQLQQAEDSDGQDGFRNIHQQAARLLSQIKKWEQMYLLYAPIDGQLTFTQRPSVGQFIPAGTTFFSISSVNENQQLLAVGRLSGRGIGKAKKGIATFVRLNAFPYKEFGELKGVIQNISNSPSYQNGQKFYQIEIELPNQLKTTFDKEISFRQEMEGLARIVTKDQSVLQRFFNNFVIH